MLTKTLRVHPDPDKAAAGVPYFDYAYTYEGPEGSDPGGLLHTGPIAGTVALKDGTAYSVTPDVIEHAPGHAGPICHHIEKLHESAGTDFGNGPHIHVCSDFCGDEADGTPVLPDAPAPDPLPTAPTAPTAPPAS